MKRPVMGDHLRQYLRERYPLAVSGPLAFLLFAGPASLGFQTWRQALGGWLTIFLGLFCLRAADDLSDLELDRQIHPERGLASGRIPAASLRRWLVLSLGCLFILNLSARKLMVVGGMALYYSVFFLGVKKRLPLGWRPFLSNIAFAVVPLYAVLPGGSWGTVHFLVAGFVWLGAVAQEWAHNVRAPGEGTAGLVGYAELFGPRTAAAVALALFLGAAALGLGIYLILGRPPFFGLSLLATSLQVAWLGVKLLIQPNAHRARPFYVFGFTFFLLPLAGLMVDRRLRWLSLAF